MGEYAGQTIDGVKLDLPPDPGLDPDAPTLRDRFAMAALNGLIIRDGLCWRPTGAAHDAYSFADAMLAERERQR